MFSGFALTNLGIHVTHPHARQGVRVGRQYLISLLQLKAKNPQSIFKGWLALLLMIRPVVDVPLMCFCQSTVMGYISIYISPTLFWNRCNGLFCWINKTNVGTGSTLQVINYVVAIDPVYFLWSLTYVVHINIIRKSCWAIRESFLYCSVQLIEIITRMKNCFCLACTS